MIAKDLATSLDVCYLNCIAQYYQIASNIIDFFFNREI